jgi:hypothetical protein
MGRFDDLLSSPGEFEAGQRRDFRGEDEDDEEGDGDRPIEPDEVEDFVEFLMTYRG